MKRNSHWVWALGAAAMVAAGMLGFFWMAPMLDQDPTVEKPAVEGEERTIRGTLPAEAVKVPAADDPLAAAAPPVTVHAQSATMTDILRQMGVEVPGRAYVSAAANRFRYSLEMEDRSFWDVFLALQTQHSSMSIHEPATDGALAIDDWSEKAHAIVTKGYLTAFCYYHMPMRVTDGTIIPSSVYMYLGIDPRLQVVEAEVETDTIRDGADNVLYAPEKEERPVPREFAMHTANNCIRREFRLALPPSGAPVIPELKIKTRLVYGLACEVREFKNIQEAVNKPIVMGKTTVNITNFREAGQVYLSIDSKSDEMTPYVIYELYDRNDALTRRWTWTGAQNSGAPSGAGGPFRLKLIVPQKVKEVKEDFVLEELTPKP